MAQSYSVSLDTIVREHNLAIVNRAVDYDRVQITTWEVSRPGLPLLHRRARHGYPARDALLGAAPSGDAAHHRALHERFYGKAHRES